MIPEHIAENYAARIAAGEDALAMAEQFAKDGYHDLAEWARTLVTDTDADSITPAPETAPADKPAKA